MQEEAHRTAAASCAFRSCATRVAPAGDPQRGAEAAKLLVAAENPVIVAGRYTRTEAGTKRLVELAELLQRGGGRRAATA